MVMDCDAQLAADYRFNQGNVEHRSVPTTEIKRRSLQDQIRLSSIEQHASWNPTDEMGEQSTEESRGRMGLCPILPNQPSTFHSAFPSKPPFSASDPPRCFCIGEHTCLSVAGPSSVIPPTYENPNMHAARPEADWTEDAIDESWMEKFVDTNACAVPDAEN